MKGIRAAAASAATPAALLALVALCAILPLRFMGDSCGHDYDFHLLSWMAVAKEWREGLFDPHWLAAANYGAGEPRLMFYPPLSWTLGAALTLVFGVRGAAAAFSGLCLFAGGVSALRLARIWLCPQAALAAACLYAANPYALFAVYQRTAYGELLAGVFVPLLLLYATAPEVRIAGIAAAFAAVWLADVPAGVLATYTLLWLAIVGTMAKRTPAPALRIGAGGLLGLGCAGFFLVPAIAEQHWIEGSRAIGLQDLSVTENFLFAHTGDADHVAVLHRASWIAVVVLAAAFAGWALSARTQKEARRAIPVALASLLPLILFFLLPPSAWIWRNAPELRYLQFPWRWLLAGACIAALFVGSAMGKLRGLRLTLAAGALVAAALGTCVPLFFQGCDPGETAAEVHAAFLSGAGLPGVDEYTPAGVDNALVQRGLPPVRILRSPDAEMTPDDQTNPVWHPDRSAEIPARANLALWNPEEVRFGVIPSAPGYAVLRLMAYPAWSVMLDSHVTGPLPRRDDGLLTIPVAAGATSIAVRWRTTPDVTAGRCLSLISLAVWVFLVCRRQRPGPAEEASSSDRAAA